MNLKKHLSYFLMISLFCANNGMYSAAEIEPEKMAPKKVIDLWNKRTPEGEFSLLFVQNTWSRRAVFSRVTRSPDGGESHHQIPIFGADTLEEGTYIRIPQGHMLSPAAETAINNARKRLGLSNYALKQKEVPLSFNWLDQFKRR